ncbi:MAG: Ig-like domain-containing protein [Candidatus Methanoperedens sp.]
MKRKITLVILLIIAIALLGAQQASAIFQYSSTFNAEYNTSGTRIDTCTICHTSVPELNLYGADLENQLANATSLSEGLSAIESLDSDGDGFTNIDEINNLTFPGNASDFPSVAASELTEIMVSPSTAALVVNATQMLTATAFDQNNIPMSGINITWASDNMTVGNVDPLNSTTDADGNASTTFTAGAAGSAMVTAMNDTITGSANITVTAEEEPPGETFNISGFKIDNDTAMGIENWSITLTKPDSTVINASTDSGGMYQFMDLPNGTYTVAEEMQAGWTNVSPVSIEVTINGSDMMDQNFTNAIIPPELIVTSFELTPGKTAALNGSAITIAIRALNVNMTETNFNGMANITINASKDASMVVYPPDVTFENGIASLEVTSNMVQFVTVTAASDNITGSATVVFADRVFDLVKGWNLVSIPNFADPSSVALALQNVQNNGVIGFDPATKLFSTPTDLQPMFGYWINVTADNQAIGFIANMDTTAIPPSRNLYEGWNLIGVSASKTDPVGIGMISKDVFISLRYGQDITQRYYSELVSYDGLNPVTVSGEFLDTTHLFQGRGYWMFIKKIPNTDVNNVPWAGKQW